MLTVQNGYILYATPATAHDYHFVDVPTQIQRSVPSGSSWSTSPPQATTTAGTQMLVGYGALGQGLCTLTDFEFYDGSTYHRVYNGHDIDGGVDYYYFMRDGVDYKNLGYSTVPIRFYVKTNEITTSWDAQGNLHYIADYPWIDYVRVMHGSGEIRYNTENGDFIRNYDINLAVSGKSQTEFLHTVSGS